MGLVLPTERVFVCPGTHPHTRRRLSSASCLTSVSLRFEAITDSGVAALACLPSLTHLNLATFGTGPARALALTLSALTRLAPQLQV
jgi:hypothetical protein